MTVHARRDAIALLTGMGLLALPAWPCPVRAAATAPRKAPAGTFLLVRRVERELGDGTSLTVERSWSCRFSPAGRGIRADGQQVACRVKAPERLAAIARLEEQRVDNGPFSALLDTAGRIIEQGRGAPVDLAAALDAAIAILVTRGHDGTDFAEARKLLAELARAGEAALDPVPADLFFPAPGVQEFSRELALPNGAAGRIDVKIAALAGPANGLLERIERTVVTHVADEARHNREVWSLAAN